jgi:hypothetical protein
MMAPPEPPKPKLIEPVSVARLQATTGSDPGSLIAPKRVASWVHMSGGMTVNVVPESRIAGSGKEVELSCVVPELSVTERELHATVIEVIAPLRESGWIANIVRWPEYFSVS